MSGIIKGLEWMSLLPWARCCYPWPQHKQEFSLVWIQGAEACFALQQPRFEPWKARASFQSFTLQWQHLTSPLNPKLNLPLVSLDRRVNLQNIWSCLVPTSWKFRGGHLTAVPQSPALHICPIVTVELHISCAEDTIHTVSPPWGSFSSSKGTEAEAECTEFLQNSLTELKRRHWNVLLQ